MIDDSVLFNHFFMLLSVCWATQGSAAFVNTDSNCAYKQLTFLFMRKLHQVTSAAMGLFPRKHLLLFY